MSSESPMTYDDDILKLMDLYTTTALLTQTSIGGSSIAALGAILEEYNDRFETLPDILTQAFSDYWSSAFNNTHEEILQNYLYVESQGYDWRSSLNSAEIGV